jgi:hypothetical protein
MVIRNRSRATSLLALLSVVLLLLATACSDDSGDEASTETTAAASDDGATTTTVAGDAEPPSESAAASLRSDLTGLLEEQVYLTGFTVQAAVADGGIDTPVAAGYVVESHDGATELADMLGGAYGVVAGNDFLAAWNDHRDAVVAYGLDGGPADAVATTRGGILDALTDMDADAAFTDVADRLEASDTALLTTMDELAAGEPAAAADLRTAADEMPAVGLDLATTIAAHAAVEGEVDSPESALRADLTGLLQESAMLTGLAIAETVQADGVATAPGPAGVRVALDDNTADLAAAIEPEDDAAAGRFAGLWSRHLDAFEEYTTAVIADDAEGIQAARDALVAFRDDVGALLAEGYPGFTQPQVAEELVDHTDSILAVADAYAADDPSGAPAAVRLAALNMRLAARSLTGGLTAPAATEDEAAE